MTAKRVSSPSRYSPTEWQDAKTVWDWAGWMKPAHPELASLFHVPNEGPRAPATGKALQKRGLCRGVPDWFLEVPRNGYHGLRIEQKRIGARLTPEQREWIERLNNNGYLAVCRFGAREVIQEISDYLGFSPPAMT